MRCAAASTDSDAASPQAEAPDLSSIPAWAMRFPVLAERMLADNLFISKVRRGCRQRRSDAPGFLFPAAPVESSRLWPRHREDGLTHPADTSRANLAAAFKAAFQFGFLFPAAPVESGRAWPPHRPREDGLTHPTHTSISNLAVALPFEVVFAARV